MKILILGGGLLGVTTAYELARRGHSVTVLDRKEMCAAETSFANGGQLSYTHAEPWANPSVLPKLPRWLTAPDSPLVFRLRADMDMIKWGLSFLRNCTTSRANINCINMLRLGLYSKLKMTQLREDTGVAFDFSARGILHIFGTQKDLDHARRHADFQAKFGASERELTRDECLALEPNLAHTDRTLVGGLHALDDENGDANMFCINMAKYLSERYGVTFRYNVAVERLIAEGGRIAGVTTSEGDINADAYVMAMGSYSPLHLRTLGINVPIYPMKGYSITIAANEFCPNISITDGTHKIVYSRLGNRLRVAGTAEFAGHDQHINERRIAPIVAASRRLFPRANWEHEISKWACLRPSTPDGPPVMGRTPIQNLFLNTGHGTLGWTQAAGSAAIVADVMEGKPTEIMTHGLTLDRYRSNA